MNFKNWFYWSIWKQKLMEAYLFNYKQLKCLMKWKWDHSEDKDVSRLLEILSEFFRGDKIGVS